MDGNYTHVRHEFPALWAPDARVLILGSIPSPKSRAQAFYYGHPQNRFWRVLAAVFGEPELPHEDIEAKKAFALRHHIALWDALEECDIRGAGDASIRNPVPTDIPSLLEWTEIRTIFCTGAASHKYYEKLNYPRTGIHAVRLPSTSPANAAVSFEKLVEAYRQIAEAAGPAGDRPAG